MDEPTTLNTEITAPVSLCSESIKRGYSVPAGILNINIAHSRRTIGNDLSSLDYDAPSGTFSRIFPIESITTHSASERNSGMLAEGYAHSQIVDNGVISNGLRNLTVQPFICVQHIAYMDFGGKVWSVLRCFFAFLDF